MDDCKQATPHDVLLMELLHPNVPKNEHEWAALREIEGLRTIVRQVLADAIAQEVLPEWWAAMEAVLKTPNVK